MGTCQSRQDESALELHPVSKPASRNNNDSKKSKSKSKPKPKLRILTKLGKSNETVLSPSEKTDATAPITPSSMLESPRNETNAKSDEQQQLETLNEENEHDETSDTTSDTQEVVQVTLGGHLGGAVIESVISEEESMGAPSDEEEMYQVQKQEPKISNDKKEEAFPEKSKNKSPRKDKRDRSFPRKSKSKKSSLPTTTRPQTRVKILSKRITTPQSIIHRTPLIAPPQGSEVDKLGSSGKSSVNPQTIANFNKLKIQVQLANRAERQRRHKAKVENRFEDVKGYRDLWNDYENIQHKVKDHESVEKASSYISDDENSLDLKDSSSWYFDFRSLKDATLDDEDNRSKTSLSLLSETNMEIQRKLFEEKRKQRKKEQTPRTLRREKRDTSDDRSVDSMQSSASKKSFVFLRGQPAEGDYGPVRQVIIPGSIMLDSDDDTPKAGSRAGDDDYSKTGSYYDDSSIISDLDMDNDYGVPRRRRRRHSSSNYDDRSVSTLGEKSLGEYGLSQNELDMMTDLIPKIREFSAPKTVEVKKSANKSPDCYEKYGFDPSAPLSSQLDLLTIPSVHIDDSDTGVVRWRKFRMHEGGASKVDSTARRLEDVYGADEGVNKIDSINKNGKSKSAVLKEKKNGDDTSTTTIKYNNPYANLTTDQFLMLSSFPVSQQQLKPDEKENRLEVTGQDTRIENKENKNIDQSTNDSTCVSAPQGCGIKKVKTPTKQKNPVQDPLIAYMPTEAFLMFSTRTVMDDEKNPAKGGGDEPGSPSNEPSSIDEPRRPCASGEGAGKKCCNRESDVRDSISIEHCDELAKDVSARIDELLSGYRQEVKTIN